MSAVNMKAFLWVGLGGAGGSMLRYLVNVLVGRLENVPFPVATMGVNLIGSFIIGILFGVSLKGTEGWLAQGGMLLLATGFCGGFTTFSTFALENISLMQKGQSLIALTYTAISLIGGLLLCRLGLWLAG